MSFAKSFFCVLLSATFCSIHAQGPNLKFKHLSLKDGLSQSIVECIIQDRQGFMWFCTEDGLNKYDGYDFTVLRNDPDDPESLSQNHVTCIIEAHDGMFWIGAFNGGLCRYNPKKDAFKIYRAAPDDPEGLCDNIIWDILQDKDGTLWLATESGLSHFDTATE